MLCFVLHNLFDLEPGAALHALLVAHGATAYATAIGSARCSRSILLVGWQRRRGRGTGLITVALLVALIGQPCCSTMERKIAGLWRDWSI